MVPEVRYPRRGGDDPPRPSDPLALIRTGRRKPHFTMLKRVVHPPHDLPHILQRGVLKYPSHWKRVGRRQLEPLRNSRGWRFRVAEKLP
eukprot:1033055-Rhodomonas_salina.1